LYAGGLYAGAGHLGGLYGGYYRPYSYGYYPYGYGYGYGYYPYYSSYGYANPYLYDYSGWPSGAAYDPAYPGLTYQPPASSNPAPVIALPAQADVSAYLTVRLPTDARLWIDDQEMTLVGPVREFHSPPITPGLRYVYNLRATWFDGRQNVTQTQRVEITGGARANATFPLLTEAPGKASPGRGN
jgi:uncharacterized protein (TIGR03000 family)